jgi:hypothetical protein
MPVHLYGVLDAGVDLAPSTPGLDGRAVRVLSVGRRFAWVSDVEDSTLAATPKRLREHDAVLGSVVAAGCSPVPARLGRLYADDSAVQAALEGCAAELDAAMALLRGRVEMSLLIARSAALAGPGDEPPRRENGGPGREHLRRLQRGMRGERKLRVAASDAAEFATRALGGIVVAERTVEDPAAPVLVGRAHLVARDDVARYLAKVGIVAAAASPALRVAVRGPGAAYSFAAVQGG